jgi:hypothetical protein
MPPSILPAVRERRPAFRPQTSEADRARLGRGRAKLVPAEKTAGLLRREGMAKPFLRAVGASARTAYSVARHLKGPTFAIPNLRQRTLRPLPPGLTGSQNQINRDPSPSPASSGRFPAVNRAMLHPASRASFRQALANRERAFPGLYMIEYCRLLGLVFDAAGLHIE